MYHVDGRAKAAQESYEEWTGCSELPIRRANRRRMDSTKDYGALGTGFATVLFKHVRKSVFAVEGALTLRSFSFHLRRFMATISYRLSESPQCGNDVEEVRTSSTNFTPREAMSKDQATARVAQEST
jgi:hypothetical protein